MLGEASTNAHSLLMEYVARARERRKEGEKEGRERKNEFFPEKKAVITPDMDIYRLYARGGGGPLHRRLRRRAVK